MRSWEPYIRWYSRPRVREVFVVAQDGDTWCRCYIGQDPQLVDVWVFFRINPFQLRMERLVACAGQASISVVDAHIGIADLEVGHVVVAGKPRRHGVGDFVGLRFPALALDETAQGVRYNRTSR